jgi:small subunit ribosomal protein S4
MLKRNYPPGMHGPKQQQSRKSQYGTQLREKQKVKTIYAILEKQFRNYVQKAMRNPGDSGENLMTLLESRLDNVVYRLGFAQSRGVARQLVSHNHILVNDKKVNIPSYNISVGDTISIKSSSKKIFENLDKKTQKNDTPSWLECDLKELKAKVMGKPVYDQVKQTLNIPLIIEFYSR